MLTSDLFNEDKWHTSPSGVKTNMPPTDDDYGINYGKNGLVAKDRKDRGVDVATGTKAVNEEDNTDYVQQITAEFIRKVRPMRSRITDHKAIIGLLDRFFDKFAIPEEYFDDVYHMAARRLESEQTVDEGWKGTLAGAALGAAALAGIAQSPHAYVDGQQVQMAVPGNIPSDAKLVTDDNGNQIYVWRSFPVKNSPGNTNGQLVYRPADSVKEGKNFTSKGGDGPKQKWAVTLKNGKKKTVNAATKAGVKDFLSSEELIIGVKSVSKVEQSVAEASMGTLMAANKIRQDKERLSKPTPVKVDNSKAQARDAAWWKAQDDAYKAGKATFEFDGKTYPLKGKGVEEGIKDKVAAGLTAAALATNAVAAPSVAGVIASQAAARNAAAARAHTLTQAQKSQPGSQPAGDQTRSEKTPSWSEILKKITDDPSVLLPKRK